MSIDTRVVSQNPRQAKHGVNYVDTAPVCFCFNGHKTKSFYITWYVDSTHTLTHTPKPLVRTGACVKRLPKGMWKCHIQLFYNIFLGNRKHVLGTYNYVRIIAILWRQVLSLIDIHTILDVFVPLSFTVKSEVWFCEMDLPNLIL